MNRFLSSRWPVTASFLGSVLLGWAVCYYQPFDYGYSTGATTDNPVDWLGV